jgi:malonate transporter and related proteins
MEIPPVSATLDIVLPVFAVMLIGYGAGRAGVFGESFCRAMTSFMFNFAIPALLFRKLATTSLPATLPWGTILAFYLAVFCCMGLGMVAGRAIGGRRLDGMAIVGLNAGFGNGVLIGMPLALAAYGDAAALPLFLIIAFHSSALNLAGMLPIELSRGSGSGLRTLPVTLAKALATNPIVLSLMLGLAWSAAGLPFPKMLGATLGLLGSAAAPTALFVMGATLPQYRIAGNIAESLAVTVLKLVVHPALVWLFATWLFAVEPLHRNVAVILAATPVGVNVYVLAARYNVGIATSTTAIFLTTALSILTLAAVLFLLLTYA